jgi:hypothetical protein
VSDHDSVFRRRAPCGAAALVCAAFILLTSTVCGPTEPCDDPTNSDCSQATWQLVLHDLPGGLLSVSGTSSSDVIAVGNDPQDDRGPLVVHYDGQSWTRLETGASGDLWWISDRPIGGDFFLTGEGGLILRYRPSTGEFETFETPGSETIFGVWGLEQQDIVAVGGDLNAFDTGGVIWHFDGSAWTDVDVSAIDPAGIPVMFKVWGRSPTELYAVGARGAVLLFDGSGWTRLDSPTQRTLFGVYGDSQLVVASGGAQSGVIIENAAASFTDVTPQATLQMNGAVVTPAGTAYTVGREGAVAIRSASGWTAVDTGLNLDPILHFHGPWSDPDGGLWAVGGNLDREPVDLGMLVYYGQETIGTELQD